MKIRHIAFALIPALALADNATTVPDDEPLLPPLPEELLAPKKGQEGLPATAQPVVSYKAPKDEEQTWLRLLYVKDTETWPDIFARMASASHEKDMQMCHGYALWLKGQELLHLRYDDDLSLSGIHADGHAYGVLFVEFNPYGIRVCPMAGYDLTGKNGGVCWQDAATQLWSWADAEKFWAELPKLLRADKGLRATSAQDTAVKREVATKGQRMVVFWAPAGHAAKSWWPSFARLHAAVGPHRFSLVALDGLNLWEDVSVPSIKPASGKAASAPAAPVAPAATGQAAAAAPTPSAPTPITAAPPLHAPAAVREAAQAATTTATSTPAAAPAATPTAATPAQAAPAANTGRSRANSNTPAAATTPPTATAAPPAATPTAATPAQDAPAANTGRSRANSNTPTAATTPPAATAATPAATPAQAAPAANTGRSRANSNTPTAATAPPAAAAATPAANTAPATAAPAPAATTPATPATPAPAPTGNTLDAVPAAIVP